MGLDEKKEILPGSVFAGTAGQELEQPRDHSKPAVQGNGQFIPNMFHKIRTSLNAVIGFSDLLGQESLTEEQKEYVSAIFEAGGNIASLMNGVLEYSRIESGQVNIEMVDCSVRPLLDELGSVISAEANEKGLEFEILQYNSLPATIKTDLAYLHQCLINLAHSAIEMTERGYVCITVSLETCNSELYLRFDIEDSGPGLALAEQKVIFEPFSRHVGNGLELSITQQLAKLLGGKVSVRSQAGKGSVFSLMIPAGVDVESQPLLNKYEPTKFVVTQEQRADNQDKTCGHIFVLMAEDDPSNQAVLTLLLEAMGLQVTIAADGQEVVAKAMTEQFDLILMDLKMPNMDGCEATKTLRKKGIKTPIVVLTANVEEDKPDECIEAGCDGYLLKPVDSRKLYEAISKYLPVINIFDSGRETDDSSQIAAGPPEDIAVILAD